MIAATLPAFGLAKVGQHIGPGPALQTELPPAVIVGGIAAYVDHAVDGARTPEPAPPGPVDSAAGEMRLGFGQVAPVKARVADGERIGRRHGDTKIPVRATGLEEKDAARPLLAQTRGEDRPGRSPTNDDEIEDVDHRCLPLVAA